MKNIRCIFRWLAVSAVIAFLAACGSEGGGTASDGAGGGLSTTGIAVDPYIVGAIFQEVGTDGTVLQRQSTPSDEFGRFSFPEPLTPGSLVTSKPNDRGHHNGEPYEGILMRRVSQSAGSLVVSPLTTMTAGDLTDQQVLDLLADAGLPGLTAADLYTDPMVGVADAEVVNASLDLAPLQANLAANAYMAAFEDYEIDGAQFSDPDHSALLNGMVDAARQILSEETFQNLANDPAVTEDGQPLQPADLVRTAASLCRSISDRARTELGTGQGMSGFDFGQAISEAMNQAANTARDHYRDRVGPNPDTPPADGDPVAGQALYDSGCASCHSLGSHDTDGFAAELESRAADIPAELAGGHNGNTLTAAQLADLVAFVEDPAAAGPAPEPTPEPTPTPDRSGAAVYNDDCAGCHSFGATDTSGFAPDLENADGIIESKLASGHQGIGLTAGETTNLVDWIAANSATAPAPEPTPEPTPVPDRDGAAVYNDDCAGCHSFGATDTSGFAPDLENADGIIESKLASGHQGIGLTAGETTNLVDWIAANSATAPAPEPTPEPTPVPDRDGAAVYNDDCAGCHSFGATDTSGFAPDLENADGIIESKLASGHQGIGLTAGETTNLVDWIAANSATAPAPEPTPEPTPVRDGATVYADDCNGCHVFAEYDTTGYAPDLNNGGSLVADKLAAGHKGITLSADEVANLVDWINQNSVADTPEPPPSPEPTQPPTGEELYATECAGCHGNLGSTDLPGRTAAQIQSAIDGNVGNMGYIALTAEQIQTLADVLPAGDPGPDYGDCTACHGQPPSGSAYPDGAGAHAVHQALPNVGTACSVCHTDASHNDWVDLAFPAAYDAKSGTATASDTSATCSNISCHGGETTPDWWTGSLDVASDCQSCHTAGTEQYNGYASGEHRKHVRDKDIACTECHDPALLASGHFDRLDTATLEGSAGDTLRSSFQWDGSTCAKACHGSKSW